MYIYVAVYACVCVCSQEKHPHLSRGIMYEDTCNKPDTHCDSRELEAGLMLIITRTEK